MQIFATSEKKKRQGEIANHPDNKTKEGTNDIMRIFERKNDFFFFFDFHFYLLISFHILLHLLDIFEKYLIL
jgi:hypothetical protein